MSQYHKNIIVCLYSEEGDAQAVGGGEGRFLPYLHVPRDDGDTLTSTAGRPAHGVVLGPPASAPWPP